MKCKKDACLISLNFFLAITLGLYFLVIALPLHFFSILILIFSDRTIKSKILWSMLPVLLWFPMFFLLWVAIPNITAQKLDFIFTSDFKGKAYIVSNVSCGQKMMIKNDREVLRIPKNGILFYAGEISSNSVNHKYFIENKDGTLQDLESLSRYMFRDNNDRIFSKNLVGVFSAGFGWENSKKNRTKMRLVVSSYNDLGKHYNSKKEAIRNLNINNFLKMCDKKIAIR